MQSELTLIVLVADGNIAVYAIQTDSFDAKWLTLTNFGRVVLSM